MGSETRYWCDRCGITVHGLEYVEIQRENADDVRPSKKFLQLCDGCCEELFAAIDAVMAGAGVA